MQFDYRKLRGKIIEVFGKYALFAKAMNISEHTISQKMNSKVFWKQDEMIRACELLGIPLLDIESYFFTLKAA